jgi:hypothetical protein
VVCIEEGALIADVAARYRADIDANSNAVPIDEADGNLAMARCAGGAPRHLPAATSLNN